VSDAMTREQMIGRAAFKAAISHIKHAEVWEEIERDAQDEYTRLALAAVAEARRIDTCETCKHRDVLHCELHNVWTHFIDGVGCNRHQPKGE